MKNRRYWFGILACLGVSWWFISGLVLHLSQPPDLGHGDMFQVYLIVKHWMETIASGNFQNLPNLPIFHGFTRSLFFADHEILLAVLALPFYALSQDVILSTNIVVVITVVASIISMFIYLFTKTQNTLASLIGATVYVFNPFMMARFPDQLYLVSLQWIPMIFLFLDKALEGAKPRYSFWFFVFLTLQLLSSLYYFAFLTVILPVYFLVRLWQKGVQFRRLLNRGLIFGLLVFSLIAITIGIEYFRTKTQYNLRRDSSEIVFYSARLSDYFFTSPSNILYGGLKQKVFELAPEIVRRGTDSEQNLFMGWVAILLLVSSFCLLPKSRYKALWKASLVVLLVSFVLTLGPKIELSLPSLYVVMQKINPVFGFVRVPARFGVMVFFALGIICALSFTELIARLRARRRLFIGVLMIVLLLIEYTNKPSGFLSIDQPTKEFYRRLDSFDSIKVILDYPIANRLPSQFKEARVEDLETHYLLWRAWLHRKTLFNGYSGFVPDEYYKRAAVVSLNFPTSVQLALLRRWGVDAIVLHRDEFSDSEEYSRKKSKLVSLGVPLLAASENLALFDLSKL